LLDVRAHRHRLRPDRLPWWHVWRAADAVGAATPKHPVIFECVGVPGVIEDIITGAPLFSRVVVVGVCMGADRHAKILIDPKSDTTSPARG
jgi:threonine dehydrogenase-like Zn-dependent dehydrogenase